MFFNTTVGVAGFNATAALTPLDLIY